MTKSLRVVSLFAFVALAPLAASADTWTGWITDASCGAKGANAEHKDCALRCHEGGSPLVLYVPATKKIIKLSDQAAAKANVGVEVKVTGTLEGDAIKVEKIEKAAA